MFNAYNYTLDVFCYDYPQNYLYTVANLVSRLILLLFVPRCIPNFFFTSSLRWFVTVTVELYPFYGFGIVVIGRQFRKIILHLLTFLTIALKLVSFRQLIFDWREQSSYLVNSIVPCGNVSLFQRYL